MAKASLNAAMAGLKECCWRRDTPTLFKLIADAYASARCNNDMFPAVQCLDAREAEINLCMLEAGGV